jgi:hypothetical protein
LDDEKGRMEHQNAEDEENEEPIRLTTFHFGNANVPPPRRDPPSRVTKRKSSRVVEKAQKDQMRKREKESAAATMSLGLN